MLKPQKHLTVRDWKQDVVQLVQFPRSRAIISPSPFALKLETWLRMAHLDYRNISNEFSKASSKGQVPFIELNGRQFADSNFIIEHLIQALNVNIDRPLTTLQRAEARAITVLVEESLFRCLAYDRCQDFAWLGSDQGYGSLLTGIKKVLFQKIMIKRLESRIKRSLVAQGYGRHTATEIEEIAKKDLNAISTLLGEKKYFFGDRPSTVDATLFGHLVQFLDTPLNNDRIKPYIEQSCPNLVAFCKRVKAEWWPDWTATCEQLALNKEDLNKEQTSSGVQQAPASPR